MTSSRDSFSLRIPGFGADQAESLQRLNFLNFGSLAA